MMSAVENPGLRTPALDAMAPSWKGAGQHFVKAALQTTADAALWPAKAALSAPLLATKAINALEGGKHTLPGGLIKAGLGLPDDPQQIQQSVDFLNNAEDWVRKQLDGGITAKDPGISVGPVHVGLGETFGGMLPFAVGGTLTALKKTDVAVSTVKQVGKAMLHAGIFSSVYETPNILVSKTWDEAAEKAKTAAVTIPFSALMAGLFVTSGVPVKWAKEWFAQKRLPPPPKTYTEVADRVFPEANAQTMAEMGVPNTVDMGGNQPEVTVTDQIHADVVAKEAQAKAVRLADNLAKAPIPTVYTGPDRRMAPVWDEHGVDIRHTLTNDPRYTGVERRAPVEPNLDIKPGLEDAPKISAAEEQAILESRKGIDPNAKPRSPRENTAPLAEAEAGEATTEQISAAYREAKKKGDRAEIDRLRAILKERFEKGEVETPATAGPTSAQEPPPRPAEKPTTLPKETSEEFLQRVLTHLDTPGAGLLSTETLQRAWAVANNKIAPAQKAGVKGKALKELIEDRDFLDALRRERIKAEADEKAIGQREEAAMAQGEEHPPESPPAPAGVQTREAKRREYFKVGNVLTGTFAKNDKAKVISYREGKGPNAGRWQAVLEVLDSKGNPTGKREVVERVPWDEGELPSELDGKTPAPPSKPPTPPPGGPPTPPTPPPTGPVPPKGDPAKAAVTLQKAFEDATERMKRAGAAAHDETVQPDAKIITDQLKHHDKMTFAKMKARLIEQSTKFVADLQRTFHPLSRLEPQNQVPFREFDGLIRYFNDVTLPAHTREIREALPDPGSRDLVTISIDLKAHADVNALHRSARVDAAIDSVSTLFDHAAQAAIEADLITPEQVRENFVNRICGYRASAVNKFLAENRPIDAQNPHGLRRVFEDLRVAAEHNVFQATLDIADLTQAYGESLMQSIARANLLKQLGQQMPNDFKWSVEPMKGDWVSLRDRVKEGTRKTIGKVRDPKTGKMIDAEVDEHLYVSKDLGTLIGNIMDPSQTKLNTPLRFAEWINSKWKTALLLYDVYHYSNLKRNGLAMGYTSAADGVKMLTDLSDPRHAVVEKLVKIGTLDVGRDADWGKQVYLRAMNEFKGQSAAIDFIKKYSLVDFANEQIWAKTHRGLKVATAVGELQKYLRDPRMTAMYSEEELLKKAGTFANNLYGGQPWSATGRSRTFDAVARLIMLAPDWFETRMNLAATAIADVHKVNGEWKVRTSGADINSARRYWAGFLAQTALFSMASNAILQAYDPKLKNVKATQGFGFFTTVALPIYDGRGRPLLLGMGGSYQYVYDLFHDAGKTIGNRQAGLMRAMMTFATRRDWKDQRIAPSLFAKENFMQLGNNMIPIPLFLQLVDIEANAAGIVNTKGTVDIVKTLARSAGTHPTMGYPAQMRENELYLEDRRKVVFERIRTIADEKHMAVGNRSEMIRLEAKKYNDEVKAAIEDALKEYRGNEVAAKLQKLFITGGQR
jgi:hypothetical protein